MSRIRIVNLRNYNLLENEILFKVDRSSPVGNPYFMLDESKRDEVCDRYDIYFKENILSTKRDQPSQDYLTEILIAINDGFDVVLGCWCYPKRCHAETIKSWLGV